MTNHELEAERDLLLNKCLLGSQIQHHHLPQPQGKKNKAEGGEEGARRGRQVQTRVACLDERILNNLYTDLSPIVLNRDYSLGKWQVESQEKAQFPPSHSCGEKAGLVLEDLTF